MTSLHFTDADRDDRGFIETTPRTLADLLPAPVQTAPAPAQTARPLARLAAGALAALLLILITYAIQTAPRAPAARPVATPAQSTSAPAPTPAPAAPDLVQSAPRAIPAYASPSGDVLGAIEATRPMTATAHYGHDWIQADVAGSGLVWLRAVDAPDLAIVGQDLTPPTPMPYIAPAVERAAPEPVCASAGVPGKMVTICGHDGLAALEQRARDQWLATYGGNIGVIRANEIQNHYANERKP